MLKTQGQIRSEYNQKINTVTDQISKIKKLIDKLSFFRMGLFLMEILILVLLVNSANDGWRILIQLLIIVPVLLFILIVRRQSKLDQEAEFQRKILWVYQNEFNILNGQENGYNHGQEFESETHPYTSDLDIFGKSSLFALLNRSSTQNGNFLLAQSLSEKTSKPIILSKQEAVEEMKTKIDDTFEFRAHLQGANIAKIELIKEQLKEPLGEQLAFTRNTIFKLYIAIVPYFSSALIIGSLTFGGIFIKLLVLVAVIHTGWNILLNSKVNQVFYCFSGGSGLLNSYASAILWTETQNWKSSYMLNLLHTGTPVSKEIKNLSNIIQKFDARLNLLVGGILNGLFLWDFRCCVRLDHWYQSSSNHVISALNHLGNFEEIIALATISHNEPGWVFPEISSTFALNAKEIGHPLIASELRVNNDFSTENNAGVDIITGSNMAGKSTFLRTLGINMVLAYAGAPVCAEYMSLSIFSINTYMRIKDSLNESTSTFKAELNRLKMILDHVVQDRDTFVLIDEMLRGTNSRDKYLGSKVFLEKLIAEKTPALFATHDLQLADLKADYPESVRNFHFDIQITDGEMRFDYKLKQGPCSTFNAAILLEEIGLSLD